MDRSGNESFYGVHAPRALSDDTERCAEELALMGYSVLPRVLPEVQLSRWRDRIDAGYKKQVAEFGEETLRRINELDVYRAPLLEDPAFVELVLMEPVLTVVGSMLGEKFILGLQNAIINRPDRPHHQSAWHRDLPYQNWVISRPLAIGALFVIDEFSAETGATMVLPASHRSETLPSEPWIENHAVSITAEPGAVLLFDAMIFHRAGINRSGIVRRAVNHLYTVPIIKQQCDIPRALGPNFPENARIAGLLGFDSQVPLNAAEWRRNRIDRN